MDRDYVLTYLQTALHLTREDAEAKLDELIRVYSPELDALTLEIDTSLTFAEEEYFLRIVNNEA